LLLDCSGPDAAAADSRSIRRAGHTEDDGIVWWCLLA
jgi:hypothetical protein